MIRTLILVAAVAASPACAQSLKLTGPSRTVTISAADIAALPRAKVTLDIHGTQRVYEGPLLIDVLAKVGAPKGAAMRGPVLGHAVIVRAADGYRVALGLAETDPSIRTNRTILADREDGKPMPKETGPFRVVVEGDLRPARSATQVVEIEVVNLGGDAAPPAGHAH